MKSKVSLREIKGVIVVSSDHSIYHHHYLTLRMVQAQAHASGGL
jgi:hypothetical protein